jgi:DNA-binding response OmpR family regulator
VARTVTRVIWPGPANLMAVTVELALLSQVSYRGLEITGSRLPGLLALLAEDPHLGCSTSRLVAGLWPDELPEHPAKALQVLVSRARDRLSLSAAQSRTAEASI